MYVPGHFLESDLAVLQGLIRACPLGAWVVGVDGELVGNHVPFLVDAGRGERGTLVGHVARGNPVWKACRAAGAGESLVMFRGPQAYVSPGWYAAKGEHGRVVPTWNYAVVHVHGAARVIEDAEWLRAHVAQLVDTHEAGERVPWKVSDAPAEFIEQLVRGIVGIEIPIARIEGKWKVSQNRSEADRAGVVEGLRARGDGESAGMATLVEDWRVKS